jgi:hypothetical protein
MAATGVVHRALLMPLIRIRWRRVLRVAISIALVIRILSGRHGALLQLGRVTGLVSRCRSNGSTTPCSAIGLDLDLLFLRRGRYENSTG